ncbi:MAG: rod shape-determining protein MreC, partial [Candidatus Omnitrophica bacterium]|nr:rod shape-determining protein MreC [Candidatus Omnitrophota bacterium]
HPRFRIGGMIKNTRIHGIIVGEGNGYAKMLYLPINEKMHIGSVVVTSGYSRVFPKGISIGKIVSVEKSSTGLYKCALIEPAANPFSQEEVLCIK